MTESAATVAVLGAGTMGHGIAHVCALAGYATRMYDVDEVSLSAGADRVRTNLSKGVELGKVDPAARDAALDRLSTTTDLAAAVADASLVVEAAPERLELKRSLLGAAAAAAPAGAILASNTSSLSISAIAEDLPEPERVAGMHFFNPVHIMALVEIVRGDRTSDDTVAAIRALAETIGKTPIVVTDSPGFASSRLGIAFGLEAIRMVEEGVATPEDIDTAMTLGYRHPMGPLRLTDLVGLDVRLDIARYLHSELESDRFSPPALLERMVAEGKLGKKSGEGFYRWDASD